MGTHTGISTEQCCSPSSECPRRGGRSGTRDEHTLTHPHPHALLAHCRGSTSMAKLKGVKFSEEGKFLILNEFSLCKDILIPKSGRYKNTPAWQRTWEEIAATNSLRPLVQCTPHKIRKKWHNMVIDARRELALEKHPLLRQRPQEKLFHIFAFFNKPGLGLPDLLLSAMAFRAARGPPGMLKVTSGLLLHGQSGAAALCCGLLWPTGTPLAPRLHFPGGVEQLRAPGCLGHGSVGLGHSWSLRVATRCCAWQESG